jgi:hypothetical protein
MSPLLNTYPHGRPVRAAAGLRILRYSRADIDVDAGAVG